MDFLILERIPNLGPRFVDPNYRGTLRRPPSYRDELPESHEVNQLFQWYLNEGGEFGVVHNFDKARAYAAKLNGLSLEAQFEVVQVDKNPRKSEQAGNFLGFDISAGFYASMIRNVLLPDFSVHPKAENTFDEGMRALSKLHRSYFLPSLNECRLFDDFDIASFCLRTLVALNDCRPNWIEGSDLSEYQVVALYLPA
jgi:hypothetical protein